MNLKNLIVASVLILISIMGVKLFGHCQIPCGIYDDKVRLNLIGEHIATISKSMGKIEELSAEAKPDLNQITRWVYNKEKHADELTEIVTYYFMAQRIKPADPENEEAYKKYVNELTFLHKMMVHAMKAKQTTDQAHVGKLHDLLHAFANSYLTDQ